MEDPVLKDISPEELEEPLPEPKWRKPVMIVLAIFLAFLVFSLMFADSLQGIIQSKTLDNSKLFFPNATIIFENRTLELLQEEFVSNQHREIKACLFGKQENDSYIISGIEFPDVIRANVIHVLAVPCPINTLVDLHSHPIDQCLASAQDVKVHAQRKQNNPKLRMMIMCSSERFAFH